MLAYADGELVIESDHWPTSHSVSINDTCVLAMESVDFGVIGGILASSTNHRVITDFTWRCVQQEEAGWLLETFDDSHWPSAHSTGINFQGGPWGVFPQINLEAHWIWTENLNPSTAYCRKNFCRGILCMYRRSVARVPFSQN